MSVLNSEVRTHPHVVVVADRCAGCQECVVRCPVNALSMDRVTWTAVADDDACVGCRQCVRTCPFGAITVEGPVLVAERVDPPVTHLARVEGSIEETRVGFASWTEALAEAERCLTCLDPTCVRGCPAHNDIPGFIGAVRDHDLVSAHDILRRTSVLPDVCSRVCNQSAQCEGACTWSLAGAAPVAIGRLERFVTDNAPVPPPARRADDERGELLSVAIIGSGPAGVGAAWDLLEAGASVSVYERDATPGGLCVWGMPDFTLPEEVARRAWDQLRDAGVDLHCGTEMHAEDLEKLLSTHDAVVVANGAGVPMRLAIPGSQLDGVIDATEFLQGATHALEPGGDPAGLLTSLGLAPNALRGAEVLVLGAGNTAMDVARTARRLGLNATCVDWLDERFALARPDELAEARAEGVKVLFQRTLVGLRGVAGRVTHAELARTQQKASTHPPKILKGDHETLDVELVIMAMGYRTDPSYTSVLPGTPMRKTTPPVADRRWTASGLLANSASSYAHHSPVGSLALARESALWASALAVRERVWVAGDALTGPATVVEAMAQGRRAAASILETQPSRPDRPDDDRAVHSTRILVGYASEGGTTARVANAIANRFVARGYRARALPVQRIGAPELARADVLIVGTWVEGLVVTHVHAARAMRTWLDELPHLAGRPVGLFCTYAVNAKDTLDEMRLAIETRGGRVVGAAHFSSSELKGDALEGPNSFASALLEYVEGARTSSSR